MLILLTALSILLLWTSGNWIHSKHQVKLLKAQLATPVLSETNTDECLINQLEAEASSGSQLAKRLVEIAKQPMLPETSAWEHSKDAKISSEERWKLFVRDMLTEKDDVGRLGCIAQWSKQIDFTEYEKVEISTMFETMEKRNEARKLFIVEEKIYAVMYHMHHNGYCYFDVWADKYRNDNEARGSAQSQCDKAIKEHKLVNPGARHIRFDRLK